MSSYFHFDEGKDGESYTRRYCFNLDFPKYRQYHDMLIPASPRPTQIDHIIVSEFGIFVIETKTMSGWIYGDADSPKWTQAFHGKKYIFQNPLRQNDFHTLTLAKYLNIDHKKMFSVVVFWGDCEFKTDLPENVRRTAFVEYIRRKKQILLTKEEKNRVCQILHDLKESNLDKSRQEHVKSLKSTEICPRCGGKLRQFMVRKGSRIGTKFIGCSHFPRCSYSRNLESS